MKSIIMTACGESARWGGQNKLLVNINGEPLIVQSVRRFSKYGTVTVMSHWPEIKARFPTAVTPDYHRWSAETLFFSEPYWSKDDLTVWAHGDVLWGERSLQKLFDPGNPSPFIIGHYSEAMGFTFMPSEHQRMRDTLLSIIYYFVDDGEQRMKEVGANMPLYRAIRGVPLDLMPHPDPATWPNFYNVTDGTVDLDTPDTLKRGGK
jgi:hypothetical protein